MRWWLRTVLHHPLARGLVFVVLFALVEVTGVVLEARIPGGLPEWYFGALEMIGALASYLVVVRLLEGRRVDEFSWRRLGGLGWGLLLGTAVCLVAFTLVWLGGWRRIDGVGLPAGLAGWVFVLGPSAAVSEEIIFRGVVFRLVEAGLGTWGSTAVSALLFGVVHLMNPDATLWGAVAIALEAGVMFALLFALTRSLWLVIGVHAAWNVVQGPVLGFAVSGATRNGDGLLRTFPQGPEWLSGGVFGLEATPVAVLLWLAVSAWAARELVRREAVVPPAWRRNRLDA